MADEQHLPTPSWKDPAWWAFIVCTALNALVQANVVPPAHWLAKVLTALINVGSLLYLVYTRRSFPGLQFWKRQDR